MHSKHKLSRTYISISLLFANTLLCITTPLTGFGMLFITILLSVGTLIATPLLKVYRSDMSTSFAGPLLFFNDVPNIIIFGKLGCRCDDDLTTLITCLR